MIIYLTNYPLLLFAFVFLALLLRLSIEYVYILGDLKKLGYHTFTKGSSYKYFFNKVMLDKRVNAKCKSLIFKIKVIYWATWITFVLSMLDFVFLIIIMS